jgi:hypothetical protein
MASTYSALKIELIATGEQSGTWGNTTNTNLGTALEEAVVGRANAIFASDADLTISLVNVNTTQVARNYILNVTSGVSLTTTRNLIVPTINKPYIIENNTTGAQSIVVKTAAGTGVTVPNGKRMMVYADSTNVVPAFNEVPSATTVTGQGTVVGTTGTQTLTNKTITFAGNTLTGVAPLNSPAFTGDPTAPTQVAGNNTTRLATTAFTTTAITDERTATATLTNKTLTSPVINTATISGGTINNTVIGGTTRAAGSFTTLDANGNVVLGDATADTISANGRFNTDVVPSTDNARDLGTTTLKWKQVYATTFTENGFPIVTQADIGTAPNEIPLNQFLGNLAYQNANAIAGNVNIGGALSVGGTTALSSVNLTGSATVTGSVEATGGAVANQLLLSNFSAASSSVLRGGATNLISYSEAFDDAAWTKTRSSITANIVVAPDGTLTGDKLVEDTTASNTHFVTRLTTVSAQSYTHTVYAKAAERSWIAMQGFIGTVNATAYFDLANGVVGTVTNGTSSIQAVGNGWYRCSMVYTVTTGTASVFAIFLATANNTALYTGDGTSGLFIWGAQLEASSTAGAYLKTVANAVTTAYAAPIESPNGIAFPLLASMTPARNGDMSFELASDTSLVVKVRGSDGTVRSVALTLA